jgi:hypothetical protein
MSLNTGHRAGRMARAVFRDPRFCQFSQSLALWLQNLSVLEISGAKEGAILKT